MARHTYRHFKALMRKNLINWKRQPVCAFFEIFAPLVLMAVICLIRWKVPSTSVDPEGMLDWRLPIIPCCGKNKDVWDGKTSYAHQVNDRVNDFFNYTGYATHVEPPPFVPTSEEFTILGQLAANSDNSLGGYQGPDYDIAYDWYGPEYFFPPQCVRQTSWAIPKRGSPIVAIIDDEDNPNLYSDDIYKYFRALKKMQRNTAAWLIVPAYSPEYFASKEELFEYVESPDYLKDFEHMGVCMGIEIKNEKPDEYKVDLYFVDQAFLATSLAYGVPSQGKPTYVPYNNAPDLPSYWKYRNRGYNLLQYLVGNKILQQQTGDENAWINMMQQPMPTETSVEDPMQMILPQILPFFLLIAYIPPVYNTVFHLVKEKESRTKESMRMMGMTDTAYWLSWFVYYTMINTAISTLSWILLLINVVSYSNIFYVWGFLWLYGQAVYGQIMFLQSLFTSSKYSGIVSTLVYFISIFFNFLITKNDSTRTSKVLASLLPQVSLSQGAVVFSNYECTGVGINYSTSAVIYQNYSFNTALWMFFVGFLFWSFIGLYFDNVLPVKFGRRKHPFFCFMPRSYKCCRGERQRRTADQGGYERVEEDDEFERANVGGNNYEPPSQVSKRQEQFGDYLKIENLQKTFDSGFQAVKGLNVKMYSNQIFALLGHNGAGKSTTISILTGLIEKSEGEAVVYDTNIFEEMGDVREFMGVCPQHDVLFDLLTPEEHLSIFYDFKGGDPEKKEDELKKMIKDVGLSIDKKKMSHTLSGGNKRKLSVSIALCGGSKFVLLDEPTSGMDLGARRYLWDMLMKYKKGRIVILTTHYMDEADVLGDRIGIMAKGQLMCLGSSLFLKNRFGAGYRLTLVKKELEAGKGLEAFLHVYFAGVVKHSETRKEINFVIPRDQTAGFKPFFEAFDDKLDEFKIKSYGVSMATLEEVFLKINQEFAPELFGSGTDDDKDTEDPKAVENSAIKGIGNTIDNSGYSAQGLKESEASKGEDDSEHLVRGSGMCATLGANTTKRFIMYRRDWCGIICEVIVPIIMVVLGLHFATAASKLTPNPPRFLSSSLLPNPQRIMMNKQPVISNADDLDLEKLSQNFPNATSGAFETHWYEDAHSYLDFYNRVFEQRNDKPLYPYRYGSYQIYQANTKNNTYHISNFVNITSQDVEALFPQYMYQALLATVTDKPDLKYEVTTSPFPVFYAFKQREEAAQSFDFAFFVSIGLALIPCVMVSYILQERELQLKHMQLISGMSLFGYWAANILADLVKSFIPILVILFASRIAGVWYEGMWLLMILYPIAVVPFSYVTSFMFTSDTVAQIVTLFLHFIAGGIMAITVYTLEVIPQTQQVGDILRWVFCIIPSYCVTHGIVFSASGSMLVKARESQADGTGGQLPEDLWAWFNLKGDVYALIAHFVVGIVIIFLIECDLFACLGKITFREIPPENEDIELDDDVVAEMERVARQDANYVPPTNDTQRESLLGEQRQNSTKQDVIRVNGFRKAYTYLCGSPVLAVEKVSFGLDYGECFALLGVNGAGKSTTFKTLTRDTTPTTGQVTIAGYDVQKDFQEARKLIGYCPQHDALFPILTVSEHLWFYAKIKGVPANKRSAMIEKSIDALNLKDHRNKLSQTLSGGNKRKLSVAIAMLGNPPIVLLDEPSAGMDPEARRFMWSVVEKISQREKKSAVIITSHSMEEAEALSTKMGIMVRGGIFRCFGSSQHVKNKYGIGYEIEVKIQKPALEVLQNISEDLSFGKNLQVKINLNRAVATCREKTQIDPLILDGISGHGLGSDLVVEADLDDNGEVKLMHFVSFLYIQQNGFKFIECLAGLFDQVEILEQCSDFYKFRVPKDQRTIGFVFGTIEDKKAEFNISEYSVSQTSLEQIFQNFANQSTNSDKGLFTFKINGLGVLVCMNPDGRSTITQTRLAQKGLKKNQEA